MENHKVEFIVVRASISELTFARIDATVTREELTREVVFLKALQGALTQWAAGTSEGKEAWEDSSEDFNVGDLSYEIGDESMKPYLEKAGIAYLNIGVECHVIRTLAWSYDTVLMDRETLKAERGGSGGHKTEKQAVRPARPRGRFCGAGQGPHGPGREAHVQRRGVAALRGGAQARRVEDRWPARSGVRGRPRSGRGKAR